MHLTAQCYHGMDVPIRMILVENLEFKALYVVLMKGDDFKSAK